MCNEILSAQTQLQGANTARDQAITQLNEGRSALLEAKGQTTLLETKLAKAESELEAVKGKLLEAEKHLPLLEASLEAVGAELAVEKIKVLEAGKRVESMCASTEELRHEAEASRIEFAELQEKYNKDATASQEQLISEYNAGIAQAQADMMEELPSYKRAAKEAGWRAALEAAGIEASSHLFNGPPPSPEEEMGEVSTPMITELGESPPVEELPASMPDESIATETISVSKTL